MKKHTIKISPAAFAQIQTGIKSFLLGKYVQPFQPGDDLVLVEFVANENISTGQTMQKKITHVLRDVPQYGLQPGFCVVSFCEKEISDWKEAFLREADDSFDYTWILDWFDKKVVAPRQTNHANPDETVTITKEMHSFYSALHTKWLADVDAQLANKTEGQNR